MKVNLRLGEVIYDSSTEKQYLVIDYDEDKGDYVHKDCIGFRGIKSCIL